MESFFECVAIRLNAFCCCMGQINGQVFAYFFNFIEGKREKFVNHLRIDGIYCV